MNVTHVDQLHLDSLAPGKIHRLAITLAHDGLGNPVRAPTLVARGKLEGPTLMLTAAVHGNELNGIGVIHRLFRDMELSKLRGSVVGVCITNVPAFRRRSRLMDDGFDLNHMFPGSPDGSTARRYAYAVMDRIVRHGDVLLDLHTASTGRVNSLYVRADMTLEHVAAIAYLQRPQVIVHNPASDGTLRGAAEDLDIPAITIEIGNPQRLHRPMIRDTLAGVRAVMGHMGMAKRRERKPGPEAILCSESSWLYTDAGGLLEVFPHVATTVEEGEPLARLVDPWGELVRDYAVPFDAVVVGHSVDPVAETGSRIAHLGVVAPADHTFHRRID